MAEKVTIEVNANFHTLTLTSVFDLKLQDKRFQEYRKRWHDYPSNFIVGDFPIHLDIESTSLCNLRCPFCASAFDKWGTSKKGFMEFDVFRRIIDEGVKNNLFSIKLSLRGEPLLHRQLVEMVKYAKGAGIIDVYFNTNAVFLNEEVIDKLIDARLDRISISFEGITKDVYERYRVGAHYEEVVENIISLKRIRDIRNSAIPQIRIQTVLLPEIKKTFKKYVKFWKPLADEVSYLDARDETRNNHPCKKEGGKAGNIGKWACPFLWQRMTILWDGTVLPCLMHGVKDFSKMSLGNVKTDSLYKMWHSDAFNLYRNFHRAGDSHKIEACIRCSYREMELSKKVKSGKRPGLRCSQ